MRFLKKSEISNFTDKSPISQIRLSLQIGVIIFKNLRNQRKEFDEGENYAKIKAE